MRPLPITGAGARLPVGSKDALVCCVRHYAVVPPCTPAARRSPILAGCLLVNAARDRQDGPTVRDPSSASSEGRAMNRQRNISGPVTLALFSPT